MNKKQLVALLCVLLIGVFPISDAFSTIESCNRTAMVNYQEVLVDTSPTLKGEGLRYYLDRDPAARSFLDKYQKSNRSKWPNAIIGMTGVSLIIGGIFTKGTVIEGSSPERKYLILGGAAVLLLNYAIAKSIEYKSETTLSKAIEEYNSRNLPHIHFSPSLGNDPKRPSPGIEAGIHQNF